MIIIDMPCQSCKNYLGKKNGTIMHCKAFPEGLPRSYYFDINPKDLKECANGYKWEPREDK